MLLAGGEEEEIILKYARALFHSVSLSKAGETVLDNDYQQDMKKGMWRSKKSLGRLFGNWEVTEETISFQ